MAAAIRWGDNDRYFGPFTWAYSERYRTWQIVLRSRGEESPCSLRISLGPYSLIAVLPNVVRPWREKVYPDWDAETVNRLGRDWYWNYDPRQYGLSLFDNHLCVYFGRTGGACQDSSLQQQWSCFLPWTQWRHVRRSLYGLKGQLYETVPERAEYQTWKAMEDSCPSVAFEIEDHDGKHLTASTRIEEREWHAGTGWFKWLSHLRRPKIRRSLNIELSDEMGPEKGSWKGGTMGTSIEMTQTELHESAFRRFCEQDQRSKSGPYRIRFIGVAATQA